MEADKARVALELWAFIDRANAPIFGVDAAGRVNEWNDKASARCSLIRLISDTLIKLDNLSSWISSDVWYTHQVG